MTVALDRRSPEQVDVDEFGGSPPEANPITSSMNVTVSIPEKITIRMVDASALSEYETWLFIASVLSNAFLGFLVAYTQDSTKEHLFWNGVAFAVLFLVALGRALWNRYKVRQKSKDITLTATSGNTRRA